MPVVVTTQPSFRGAHVGLHFDPTVLIENNRLCPATGEGNDANRNPLGFTWFLGEFTIERSAKAGLRPAKILVSGANEDAPSAALEIDLNVWGFSIPEKPSMPIYAEYTSWFGLLGHFGKWSEGEGELNERYTKSMIEHRVYPLKSWISRPPLLDTSDGAKPRLNLGQSVKSGESFRDIVLEARPSWAVIDFPTFDSTVSEASRVRWWKAVNTTVEAEGLHRRAISYFWDEPAPQEMSTLVEQLRLARRAAPALRLMVTTTLTDKVRDLVDIIVPVMDWYDVPGKPKPVEYRKFQGDGGEVWWYVSCMSHGCSGAGDSGTPDLVLDRPASYVRSIGWLSRKYSIDAFLYYSVDNAYQKYPKRDPWKDTFDFTGNGDGNLFYPGRKGERGFTEQTPVPTLRLKLLRETSFDADYVALMQRLPAEKQPPWWRKEFNDLIQTPRTWNRNYRKYAEFRKKIGDWLAGVNP